MITTCLGYSHGENGSKTKFVAGLDKTKDQCIPGRRKHVGLQLQWCHYANLYLCESCLQQSKQTNSWEFYLRIICLLFQYRDIVIKPAESTIGENHVFLCWRSLTSYYYVAVTPSIENIQIPLCKARMKTILYRYSAVHVHTEVSAHTTETGVKIHLFVITYKHMINQQNRRIKKFIQKVPMILFYIEEEMTVQTEDVWMF